MSIFDFIRGFFGLSSRVKDNENSWFKKPTVIGDNEDDDDDDDYDDNIMVFDENRHGPFGFNVFSGNMHDMHRYFQQQMNEIIKNFESPWFSNPGMGNFFNAIDHGNSITNPEMNGTESPRNKFLKPSHEQQRKDAWTQNGNDSQAVQIPQDRSHGFGGFFNNDALDIHKFFEQQIDDIMKRFSSSFFNFDEGNTFGLPDENPGRVEEFVHPRNKFFKPSYEHPQGFKADSDIDNESYAPKVFGKLLDQEPVQPPSSSFISRSMMTTHQRKILPNGGIEEKRKSVKDGKEEVTVSRQIGDRRHVVTTIKMPDGSTTKSEEFINFDEGQLGDFYKSWNKM